MMLNLEFAKSGQKLKLRSTICDKLNYYEELLIELHEHTRQF